MRRTRVVVSPANIHQKGGQIVNFTFFSDIFLLDKIPIILESIFDIPQICYANVVADVGGTFERKLAFWKNFFRRLTR